jgi:hypothetical protein
MRIIWLSRGLGPILPYGLPTGAGTLQRPTNLGTTQKRFVPIIQTLRTKQDNSISYV